MNLVLKSWFNAVDSLNKDTVRKFIEEGIEVNSLDENGENALFRAVYPYGGSLEIVKLLIDAGIDINIINKKGESAIQVGFAGVSAASEYAEMKNIETYLLDKGFGKPRESAKPQKDSIQEEAEKIIREVSGLNEYKMIKKYYGNQRAKRSQVLLMNHIDEGVLLLRWLKATEIAQRAYCLHPISQGDEDLQKNYELLTDYQTSKKPLLLAMEYRNIANQYLSQRTIQNIEEIKLSPLTEVNLMLVADKIQNRKDFELYHEESHERSPQLKEYFRNWLTRLGISEDTYQHYKGLLTQISLKD